MPHGTAGDMTLLFDLGALRQLASPAVAVADARTWSEQIGIVTDGSPEEITKYINKNDVHADFTSGDGSVAGSLAVARQRFPTERHVFVGVSEEHRGLTQSLGWEYLDVREAAKAAGWQIIDR